VLGLAAPRLRSSYGVMAMSTPPDLNEQQITGRVIRAIRVSLDRSQGDVAARLGMTSQGFQKYEAGERKFTHERMRAILEALGVTEAEYEIHRARVVGGTPRAANDRGADLGRRFVFDITTRARFGPDGPELVEAGATLRTIDLQQLLGSSTDAIEMPGDAMRPWAQSGETILFDRDRYPKPGAGCVIETKDGAYLVRLYERTDGSTLFARELYPEERTVPYKLADVAGVYAVRLRGD
jgi:transcriptional regulator with XRE-family HTH domain